MILGLEAWQLLLLTYYQLSLELAKTSFNLYIQRLYYVKLYSIFLLFVSFIG